MKPILPGTMSVKKIKGATHYGAFTLPSTETETDKKWVV